MKQTTRAKRILGLAAFVMSAAISSYETGESVKRNPTALLETQVGVQLACAKHPWYTLRGTTAFDDLGCYNNTSKAELYDTRKISGLQFFDAIEPETNQKFRCQTKLYNFLAFANPRYSCNRQ